MFLISRIVRLIGISVRIGRAIVIKKCCGLVLTAIKLLFCETE